MEQSTNSVTAPLPRGTVTFLCTDIESSARGPDSYDDSMVSRVAQNDAILRSACEQARGVVVRSDAGRTVAVFTAVGDALDAALSGQKTMASTVWPAADPLRVRMGIHTGWCEPRGQDYFGSVIDRAEHVADAGHGQQIFMSSASAVAVEPVVGGDTKLVPRGTARLKDLAEPIELFQVVASGLDNELLPLRSLSADAHDLPVQHTTFIGRSQELERTVRAIEAHRLVTLTGIGGVGKTRLATHVGAELSQQFGAGIRFIDLAGASDSRAVTERVLDAISPLSEGSGAGATIDDPVERIIVMLAPAEILLIADNCEHVVEEASRVLSSILVNCHQVRVLATSREALRLPGEQVIAVAPLEVPSRKALSSGAPAMRLFVERAVAAGAQPPGPEATETVTRICRLVDGLPLGIELAAARTLHLSLDELATRLEGHYQVLVARDRTQPERHQTLERVLLWSYELLEPAERLLLSRLGMFAGPIGLSAIEVACSDAELPAHAIIDHLGALVDRSLVVHEDQAGRYTLLNVVRRFARDRLGPLEAGRWAERHAEWCATSLEQANDEATDDALAQLMMASGTEVSAALSWAIEAGSPELAWRLAGATWRWFEMTGRLNQGLDLLERAMAKADPAPTRTWAAAAEGAASLAMALGDLQHSCELHRQAIDAFCASEDVGGEAWGRTGLAMALMLAGDPGAAAQALQALTTFEATDDRRGAGHAHASLGIIAAREGDAETAERHYLEALSILRLARQRRDTASVLSNLGNLAHDRSELLRASRFYDGALQLYRETGDHRGAGLILNNLCLVAQARGDGRRAVELAREAIGEFDAIGDRQGSAAALHNLANLAAEAGDPSTALAHYDAAIAGFRDALDPRGVAMTLDTASDLARRCGADGRAWRYEIQLVTVLTRLGLPGGARRSMAALSSHAGMLGYTDLAGKIESAAVSMANDQISTVLEEARLIRPEDRLVDHSDDLALPGLSTGPDLSDLTGRERELLIEVGRGRTNSEIAETLYISRRTVDAHLSHIRTKLGISDRSKLIVMARDHLDAAE